MTHAHASNTQTARAAPATSAPAATYIADLHIHSHYSRATSKDLDFEHLTRWAQLKGVHLVGTGDLSHPGWLQEMHDKLEPAEDGLFQLKPELARAVEADIPPACRHPVRFLLAGEISNIYKRAAPQKATGLEARSGDVRKVHNLVYAPDLADVAAIQTALEKIGNIRADGRPILGLDSRDLLEIILEVNARCVLIPAHIWTPWFSMLGSKSGFDSVEDCFADLTPHIFALETGLSSDPPMNWRVSNLDGYTLVSNSDAHSPQKLAREATLFHCELSYDAIFDALRQGDPARFGGTLEFFPEEGKYHMDGHRKCQVCWTPEETLAHQGLCPVCGKPVTVGVQHRVETLADRPPGGKPARTHPFVSLIPLPEVLAEVHGVGAQSRRVQREYHRLLDQLGPELVILRQMPLEDIRRVGGERLAAGIERMRRGHVLAQGGYDGEYGVVKVLDERLGDAPQLGLFGTESVAQAKPATSSARPAAAARVAEPSAVYETTDSVRHGNDANDTAGSVRTGAGEDAASPVDSSPDAWQPLPLFADGQDGAAPDPVERPDAEEFWAQLNAEQAAAVQCVNRSLLIVAGPGTGKTHTLTTRIAYLVQGRGVAPESILAITFTNKAAEEMAARLSARLGETIGRRLTVQTFHALGAQLLREFGHALTLETGIENIVTGTDDGPRASAAAHLTLPADFGIAAEEDQDALLTAALPDLSYPERTRLRARISHAKNRLQTPADFQEADAARADGAAAELQFARQFAAYEAQLRANHLVDYDDLIALSVRLLETAPAVRQVLHDRYRWISVDEYQDVNAAQARLLQRLVGEGANLCAIGDPDQAIYGFRGADYRHFFAFQQDFPDAATFYLARNYRSPQSLLTAAGQVIAHNPDRAALKLWSDFTDRVQLDVYSAATDRAEAEYIVQRIDQMVGGASHFALDSGRVDGADEPETVRGFGDFAVLFRLHAQAALLAEALERAGIPFQLVGGPGLNRHPETRWLARALHTLAVRPTPQALARLCAWDAPPGEVGRLQTALRPILANEPDAREALARVSHSPLASQTVKRAALLAHQWPQLAAVAVTGSAHATLAGLIALLDAQPAVFPQADTARLARLLARAQAYDAREQGALAGFAASLALEDETDAYDPRADRVTLMTIHAVKGLEFPVVFLAGCEEGLLPYTRVAPAASIDVKEDVKESGKEDVEEERRLFYVGMTRAQSRLILTHARRRMIFGRTTTPRLSRFVDDIEETLKALHRAAPRSAPKVRPEDQQLSLF